MRARTQLLLALPAAALLAVFFALPVAAVAIDALREGAAAFAGVLALPPFWPSLGGSALLTVVAASLSTAVGLAAALHAAVVRHRAAAHLLRPDRRLRVHPRLRARGVRDAAARVRRIRRSDDR